MKYKMQAPKGYDKQAYKAAEHEIVSLRRLTSERTYALNTGDNTALWKGTMEEQERAIVELLPRVPLEWRRFFAAELTKGDRLARR